MILNKIDDFLHILQSDDQLPDTGRHSVYLYILYLLLLVEMPARRPAARMFIKP